MLSIKAEGYGEMSPRSDVNEIYSMWNKLYSSIIAIDPTDTSGHVADDKMGPIMPF